MDFELTISGLCVVVLRSEEERPTSPAAVDVLCVGGHHDHGNHAGQPLHRPRLSYLPEDILTEDAEADLVVDPSGRRIAFLDLAGQALALRFRETPYTKFSVAWGPAGKEAPLSRDEDAWMNWVPMVGDLGFNELRLGEPGELVPGAGAVISLPEGVLTARNVVRKPLSEEVLLWKFFPTGQKEKNRAVANEVVFRAEGVNDVYFLRNGDRYLEASKSGGTLRMAVSNDLASVSPDYPNNNDALKHLVHIEGLASGRSSFQEPKLYSQGRTGHPICNQALYVTNR